jgi:hypothetical protein
MKLFSILLLSLFGFTLFSCNNNTRRVKNEIVLNPVDPISKLLPKPPATYPDTLTINFPTAVFYHPDSLQLLKIKEQTDSMMFDGSMHEFFYQMRNARIVIKKSWPELSIIEAKNYRYLLFIKQGGTRECIDLDTKNDAYGLFVFNGKKAPLAIDMTNIETEVSFYLK